MKTKEYLQKLNIDDRVLNPSDLSEYWKTTSQVMQEYSDFTNAKLVEENDELKEVNKNYGIHLNSAIDLTRELQSELSAAKERVNELEKNARQLCTLLAKDHILFFLSQGEKDGIMDILKTLTPKQHGK